MIGISFPPLSSVNCFRMAAYLVAITAAKDNVPTASVQMPNRPVMRDSNAAPSILFGSLNMLINSPSGEISLVLFSKLSRGMR